MWYFIFSLITAIAIIIEKSKNDKRLYLLLSIIFPTIGYSLWRISNNSDSGFKLSPIKRMCFWYVVIHSLLSMAWILSEFAYPEIVSQRIGIIISLWASVIILAGTIYKVYDMKKTIVN